MVKVFVSYSHQDAAWVRDRMVPCLEAGGAEVLADYKRFTGGTTVQVQIDTTQDQADRQVLVLTHAYHASAMCQHEMKRAIAKDPTLNNGVVVVVRRDDTPVPPSLNATLYADLRDDSQPAPWDILLTPCSASLGTTAPHWLEVRDEVVRRLSDHRSVNLVVSGSVKWRPLIDQVSSAIAPPFPVIDLTDGATMSRRTLLEAILRSLGDRSSVPVRDDLATFSNAMKAKGLTRLGMVRFERARGRAGFDEKLHGALRFLAEAKLSQQGFKLLLLIQSRGRFEEILPGEDKNSEAFLHPVFLSSIQATP